MLFLAGIGRALKPGLTEESNTREHHALYQFKRRGGYFQSDSNTWNDRRTIYTFYNLNTSKQGLVDTMTASASASQTHPINPFGALINQETAIVPSFTFESGATLTDIPVAYKTWGKLNARADNVLVICHALTGSADVEDWYALSWCWQA